MALIGVKDGELFEGGPVMFFGEGKYLGEPRERFLTRFRVVDVLELNIRDRTFGKWKLFVQDIPHVVHLLHHFEHRQVLLNFSQNQSHSPERSVQVEVPHQSTRERTNVRPKNFSLTHFVSITQRQQLTATLSFTSLGPIVIFLEDIKEVELPAYQVSGSVLVEGLSTAAESEE